MSSRRAARGLSLVELVVFIVVLGVAFAGMLVLYNQLTRASIDPLVRKQALALASSVMEEVQLRAFTFCDPDDPAVHTATVPGDCGTQEVIGVEGGETRATFDNVSDYHGLQMGAGTADPVTTAAGTTVDGTADYFVAVTVAQAGLAAINATESLLIAVTARHVPSGTAVTLQGYRTRYAPRSP
jgi:MSHA pilin protein MshD